MVGDLQYVDSEELPLDYGGVAQFFAQRPPDWWSRAKHDIRYELPDEDAGKDSWDEEHSSSLATIPEKPLSFLWIKSKTSMLNFDVKLPTHLPHPTRVMIAKGLQRFPPPKVTNNLCSGVKKLSDLLENGLSTWISVTAKGLDIEQYVDLHSPVPGITGLQPVCPNIEGSPILAMDHLPAYSLSDQFLFYKPEKLLTDVSLANVCHQAGLLHSALIIASSALSISKNIVGIHFSIANIYASIGNYQLALEFYYSTLALQSNFEPAKERIRAIYCHSRQEFNLYTT
ncbi:hypothetical protein WR25_01781 [Diploscapter pachys]|uniref:Uncharacterized protein n=1 Tax=Diploscapter pachys TaxID=2018661 RepID=A0A2A2JIG7_9BILA|nr:hypothetical protein WR25_01781 [Diploscapter pachys]